MQLDKQEKLEKVEHLKFKGGQQNISTWRLGRPSFTNWERNHLKLRNLNETLKMSSKLRGSLTNFQIEIKLV